MSYANNISYVNLWVKYVDYISYMSYVSPMSICMNHVKSLFLFSRNLYIFVNI